MTDENALGRFLRSRREELAPHDVDLPTTGRRRVPGLRREEVAVLAGLSTDYYTRIERGRECRPSGQVVEALSRALGLRDDELRHLYRLAGLDPAAGVGTTSRTVAPELRRLMNRWDDCPALVVDRALDVLARNDLATALHSGFTLGDNLVRMTFLDPFGRRFFTDWDRVAGETVGHLRLATGHQPGHPRLRDLVAEASAGSARFRELWERHRVVAKTRKDKRFTHPSVGDLDLTYETFDVTSSPGQQLVVYQAMPGSPSEDGLRLLGSLAATGARR
ncbi:Helix-turn-helix domain-containing protein [Lentzea fradiae]|uniref:Helix-turn-helix domain-containing protein n=1 Tax=Lentzea fradiae TaxID=200378 RepID=A0A1G7UKN0_9PSEU|nr:helix-turn-helix transcriptional regulator [Lentzea fradiae]SDG48047.1 Helix-turn-helix domain-containing protein [Lentzea fradiae]